MYLRPFRSDVLSKILTVDPVAVAVFVVDWISATLSTNYEKKGSHRFHIAVQTRDFSQSISCILNKGQRTREEEE